MTNINTICIIIFRGDHAAPQAEHLKLRVKNDINVFNCFYVGGVKVKQKNCL